MYPFQNFIKRASIGVRYENLSKPRARNKFNNLFHPVGIKPVENIIEQQYWSSIPCLQQKMKLCQLE